MKLELLVPGLLGDTPSSTTPALCRLLSRATASPTPGRDLPTLLARHFRLSDDPYPPVAALTRLADTGEADGYWLRADPVHLHADLRQVLLTHQLLEDLDQDEATVLTSTLNENFEDLGWRFHAPHPRRWYLHTEQPAEIATHPPWVARGRDVRPLLPTGQQARLWHAHLTEIQMLLFEHPLNQAREARGAAKVNSVWFWGEGGLPIAARYPAGEVYGNDPLLRGLARLAGGELHPLPSGAGDWLEQAQAPALVVLDALVDCDPQQYGQVLNALERRWFSPLLNALRRGALAELKLSPGDGYCYRLTPGRAWRIWRRSRTLASIQGERR